MARKQSYGREAWEKAKALVAEPDGLVEFPTKGMWTAKKLFFLCSYLEQTSRGMGENKYFPAGLTFVDLFGGCGVSLVTDTNGTTHRYPGSSLIAATFAQPKGFRRIISVDIDSESVAACKSRVLRAGYTGDFVSILGDSNQVIDEVVSAIPRDSLAITFVDPKSLDVHYRSLVRLTQQRRSDLIILVSDRIDFQRNVELNYYNDPNSKLDDFLGQNSNWRERYDALPDRTGESPRNLLMDIYRDQLAKIGYIHSWPWILAGKQGPMFKLVYASKSDTGLKYCKIAKDEDFDGQKSLF